MAVNSFLKDKIDLSAQGFEIKPGIARVLLVFVFAILGLTFAMKGGFISLVGIVLVVLSLGMAASLQRYSVSKNGLVRTPLFSQFKSFGWPQQPAQCELSGLKIGSRDVKGNFQLSSHNGVVLWPFNNAELFLEYEGKSLVLAFTDEQTAKSVIENIEQLVNS